MRKAGLEAIFSKLAEAVKRCIHLHRVTIVIRHNCIVKLNVINESNFSGFYIVLQPLGYLS